MILILFWILKYMVKQADHSHKFQWLFSVLINWWFDFGLERHKTFYRLISYFLFTTSTFSQVSALLCALVFDWKIMSNRFFMFLSIYSLYKSIALNTFFWNCLLFFFCFLISSDLRWSSYSVHIQVNYFTLYTFCFFFV